MLDNPDGHLFYVDGNPFVGSAVRHWADGGVVPVMGPATVLALALAASVCATAGWWISVGRTDDDGSRVARCWQAAGALVFAATVGAIWDMVVWSGGWGSFSGRLGMYFVLAGGAAGAAVAVGVANGATGRSARWGVVASVSAVVAIIGSFGLVSKLASWDDTLGYGGPAMFAVVLGLGSAMTATCLALMARFGSGGYRVRSVGTWVGFVLTLLAITAFVFTLLTATV
jgi:hypothetical protein